MVPAHNLPFEILQYLGSLFDALVLLAVKIIAGVHFILLALKNIKPKPRE